MVRLLVATVVLSSGLHAEQAGTVVGDLRVESFHSSVFGDIQTLRVWLPPGYHDPANATRRYPVLYFNRPEGLFVEQPGAQHNEKDWQARFPRAISYLYPTSTP